MQVCYTNNQTFSPATSMTSMTSMTCGGSWWG